MKILKELRLIRGGKKESVYFGIPDNQKEIDEMYRLRFQVYSERGYINKELYPGGIEKDEYDESSQSKYFVAVSGGKIIGSIRLIQCDPLPIKKDCFNFETPIDIKKIPKKNRAELGRLIVVPLENGDYLPRNIVMLFLISCLTDFGLDNNVFGGYAFIKQSLENKLNKLKMPIYLINNYEQIYPKSGVLYRYFSNSEDKVVPVYFITEEFKKYIDEKINNSMMFNVSGNTFVLRENLYNSFLKLLKII